jgi:hypothetical protein
MLGRERVLPQLSVKTEFLETKLIEEISIKLKQ